MSRHVIERHRLGCGLELAVLPDPSSPAVAVNLTFHVGSVDEDPRATGFAHLFEHLMFQGSAEVAPGEHMATIEALGGTVNAYTSSDRTVYHETVPPGALELVLWLEADRMRSLDISQTNLDAQREVVAQEKAQRYDNRPYGDLLDALVTQHFPADHPYGHLPIGSMAHLEEATLTDVTAFHRRWYRPSNARLVLAGAVDPALAIDLVERHFGNIDDAPIPARPSLADPWQPPEPRVLRGRVPHPLVHTSWLAPPAGRRDFLALELGLAVLTEGHASRLHRRLVKETGLAQEVHGFLIGHLRSASLAVIQARPSEGIPADELEQALAAELAAFTGPEPKELARARAKAERDWLEELAGVEGRAAAAADAWLVHGDPEHMNTHLAELSTISGEDIAHVLTLGDRPAALHYLPEELP
ncbi:MAG: pitrilysin family protein [Propionibacteriaceae bacterium]|nr:pitrilysin family protein [Propionibacteriaceae bacterium]